MNSALNKTLTRSISNFSVIGSGLMGAGIAQVGAQTGHNVVIYDINETALEKSRSSIEKSLMRVAKKMDPEKSDSFISETLR